MIHFLSYERETGRNLDDVMAAMAAARRREVGISGKRQKTRNCSRFLVVIVHEEKESVGLVLNDFSSFLINQ